MASSKRAVGPGPVAHAAFALLAFLSLLLCVDFTGFVGGSDPKSAAVMVPDETSAAWIAADSSARRFLEVEHQIVTGEIQGRIQLEHLLFGLKFVLVGGILYTLFHQAPVRSTVRLGATDYGALITWAAVVAASVVDLRLAANQAFITTLGTWVRHYEELRLGGPSVGLGWEAFLADQLLGSPFYPALRISGQVITTLLFAVAAAISFLSTRPSEGHRALWVSGVGAVLSVLLMTIAGMTLRGSHRVTYLVLGVAAAVVAVGLAVGARRRDSANRSGPAET